MHSHWTKIKTTLALFGLVWVGLLASCGSVEDATKARVRFVNASLAYSQLDLYVDSSLRSSGVTYGSVTGTLDIAPGKAASELRFGGSASAILGFTPTLSRDKNYTLLVYGKEGALKTVLLDENNSAPDSGKARLRVINAAADAGAVDVYVTAPEQRLAEASVLQADAAYGALGSFITVDSGTRRLRVTVKGSRTELRLDISNLVLSSKEVATIVIAPGPGGVLLQALLITEGGGVTRLDSTQARVRAVAGLASGNNVSVNVNVAGAALLNGDASPVVGGYFLVPAGDTLPVVTLNLSAVASVQRKTLLAGTDYTLLVYGPPQAARVSWITDANSLPADTTKAQLRLVNIVVDPEQVLSLKVDATPLANGVQPATASSYALLSPSTTAVLSVNGSSGLALATTVPQTFAAGSSYSYFVSGAASGAVGSLSKDR